MVKRTKDEEALEEQYLEPEEVAVENQLEELKKKHGDTGLKVEVFHLPHGEKEFVKIAGKWDINIFDADLIAQEYGGGQYKFVVKDEQGRIRKQFTNKFADKKTPINPYPLAPIVKSDDSAKQALEILKEQISQSRADAKENMNTTLSIVKEMTASMKSAPVEARNPIKDFAEIQALLNAMQPHNPPAVVAGSGMGLKELLDIMPTLKKLFGGNSEGGSESNGDGGGITEKIIMALANPAIEAFSQKLMANKGQVIKPPVSAPAIKKPVNAQEMSALSVGNVIEEEKTVVKSELTKDEKVVERLRGYMPVLVAQAKSETPPASIVDFVYGVTSENDFDDLQEYLKNDGAIKMVKEFPELNLYKEWLSELVDVVVHYFDEPKLVENDGQPMSIVEEEKPVAHASERVTRDTSKEGD